MFFPDDKKSPASLTAHFSCYWVTLNLADTPDPSVVPKVYLDAIVGLPLLIAITGEVFDNCSYSLLYHLLS